MPLVRLLTDFNQDIMNKKFNRKRLSKEQYIKGVLENNRVILSKAITLVESKLVTDNDLAQSVITEILPQTGNSLRIGITGVPGAGKSTFIESFGAFVISQGLKVAVLTIDPSSQISGGSILGDKTRMEALANNPMAYVRPSASGDTLGGVGSKTRETMLLCEAAGYDVIIIETVGVGQSETTVKGIVDFFLLLMLTGAGDELQGIKRGIMEMADAIAINKADGENIRRCNLAQREFQNALHMFPPSPSGWVPKVLTCSALNREGISKIWEMIQDYKNHTIEKGYFELQRQRQNKQWMNDAILYYLNQDFRNNEEVVQNFPTIENEVLEGKIPAITGAKSLLKLFKGG